jgi:hypothetical protein
MYPIFWSAIAIAVPPVGADALQTGEVVLRVRKLTVPCTCVFPAKGAGLKGFVIKVEYLVRIGANLAFPSQA